MLQVRKDILEQSATLLQGCGVGEQIATAGHFNIHPCGNSILNDWIHRNYKHITHDEVVLDCFDLWAENGSNAFVIWPFRIPVEHHHHHDLSKKYNFTIISCTNIFGTPRWFVEWLQYQRPIGTDHVHKGVGKGGLGGLKPPPIFKLLLLCAQAVTAKGCPKFWKQEKKKQLSGYKQCYIYKNQGLVVSKYMILLSLHAKKLDHRGLAPPLLKSCLRPWFMWPFKTHSCSFKAMSNHTWSRLWEKVLWQLVCGSHGSIIQKFITTHSH